MLLCGSPVANLFICPLVDLNTPAIIYRYATAAYAASWLEQAQWTALHTSA